MFVEFRFDALVHPYGDDLMDLKALSRRLRLGVAWNTQASGVAVEDDLANELEAAWIRHTGTPIAVAPHAVAVRERQHRSISLARRKARDSRFSRVVRAKAKGRCAACSVEVNYGALGVLETAHIKSVEADGPDDLSNALPLCPLHHALFDQFLWKIDTRERVMLSNKLPKALRTTFAAVLKQPWKLHRAHLAWHRRQLRKGT